MRGALHPRLAAWAADGERVRTRRGERVFGRTEGTGPDVLFLHGFPTHSYDWQAQVAALSDSRRCTTPDFLGFGLSDKPRRTYSVFDQADVIEDVAAAAGIGTCALVAHDYGGTVAQVLLHRRHEGRLPFAVRSATFLNGGLLPREHRPLPIQWAMADPALGRVLSSVIGRGTIRRSFDRIFGERKICEEELDALWSGMAHADGTAISWRLLRYMEERPRHEALLVRALTEADVPLTFVWGPDDPISGEHVAETLEALLPDAAMHRLRGVGHYPQIEAPDAVTTVLREVL